MTGDTLKDCCGRPLEDLTKPELLSELLWREDQHAAELQRMRERNAADRQQLKVTNGALLAALLRLAPCRREHEQ